MYPTSHVNTCLIQYKINIVTNFISYLILCIIILDGHIDGLENIIIIIDETQ